MTDILSTVDATVDGLCACGCGAQLSESGPSGWFATEWCQRRFQGGIEVAPRSVVATYAPGGMLFVGGPWHGTTASMEPGVLPLSRVVTEIVQTDAANFNDPRTVILSLRSTVYRLSWYRQPGWRDRGDENDYQRCYMAVDAADNPAVLEDALRIQAEARDREQFERYRDEAAALYRQQGGNG